MHWQPVAYYGFAFCASLNYVILRLKKGTTVEQYFLSSNPKSGNRARIAVEAWWHDAFRGSLHHASAWDALLYLIPARTGTHDPKQ